MPIHFCKCFANVLQGGHKPGKPEYSGISLNMENPENSVQPQGKIVTKVFLVTK